MVTRVGKFVQQEDGTVSFIYENGQVNDCQTVLAMAKMVFKDIVDKEVSISIDITTTNSIPEKAKELRNLTGLSILECKKTLNLFDGNIDKALEFVKLYYVEDARPDRKHWDYKDYVDYMRSK